MKRGFISGIEIISLSRIQICPISRQEHRRLGTRLRRSWQRPFRRKGFGNAFSFLSRFRREGDAILFP